MRWFQPLTHTSFRAMNGVRFRNLLLGKQALYRLSYHRKCSSFRAVSLWLDLSHYYFGIQDFKHCISRLYERSIHSRVLGQPIHSHPTPALTSTKANALLGFSLTRLVESEGLEPPLSEPKADVLTVTLRFNKVATN